MSGKITGLEQYNTDASPRRSWRDDLNRDWLGTSTEASIRGRILDEDGEIKANLGDWIVGNSTLELTNAAKKRQAKTFRKTGDRSVLLSKGINVGIDDTDAVILKKLADVDAEELAIASVRDTGEYKGDLKALKGKGASYINSLLPELNILQRATLDRTNPETIRQTAATDLAKTRYEAASELEKTRHQENMGWMKSRALVEDNRYKLGQERLWQENQADRQDRALTRQMNAENNAMQMQLEYSRLDREDRRTAQDRKDKAVMALLSGLGNLGSFLTV